MSNPKHDPKDVQRQLRQFLSISSSAGERSKPQDWSTYSVKDLTDTSTSVLLNVPASRQNLNLLPDTDSITIDETVSHFCSILNDKMKENPSLWRKMVLKWSVDLLAKISQANAGRRATTFQGAPKSLKELMQLYTACTALHNVAQLLKTCIKDMTCFPQTTFSRLLSTGLQEFDNHVNSILSYSVKKAGLPLANQMQEKYSQKIRSLSAIFGHLARQRSVELTQEIRQLILKGLSRLANRLEQRGIPFLFKLTTFSKELLQLVIKEMEDLLTIENLLTAARILTDIPSRVLVPDEKTTPDKLLVGMLSVLSQSDVVPLFERLMSLAFEDIPPEQYRQSKALMPVVKSQAFQIMEYFLSNLEIQVHGELAFSESDIPILDAVLSDLNRFVRRLYSHNEQERQYVFRLLVFLALAKGETVAVHIGHLIIFSAENPKQVESFLALCTLLRPFYPNMCETLFEKLPVFCAMREDASADQTQQGGNWLKNLRTLMIWERNAAENSDAKLMKLRDAAQSQFAETGQFLLSVGLSGSVERAVECVEVLEAVGPCVHQLPQNSILLTQKLVQMIVWALETSGSVEGGDLYWKCTEYCLFFLSTQATFCQEVFLRALLDTVFEEGPLFRRLLLVDLVDRFCQANYKPRLDGIGEVSGERETTIEYSAATCKILAVILTEKLCPDCIASEHIWEEWSYAKTNLERFLAVQKNVESYSFAWDLLLLCAEVYPCLWYCIPVVKSILGAVMAQLEGSVVKSNVKVPPQFLGLLDKWFLLTRKGSILPENLSYFYEILPVVSQYEAFTVLGDIWTYFQHTTPDKNQLNQHFEYLQLRLEANGENRIAGVPQDFTEASRYVVQANIGKLGFLFPKLFPVLDVVVKLE